MNNEEMIHEIAKALGGYGRLSAMVGAKNFVYDLNPSSGRVNLKFNFKGTRKANICRVTLNGRDLYNVEFFKLNNRTFECPKVHEVKDLPAENLKMAFTGFTDLELVL